MHLSTSSIRADQHIHTNKKKKHYYTVCMYVCKNTMRAIERTLWNRNNKFYKSLCSCIKLCIYINGNISSNQSDTQRSVHCGVQKRCRYLQMSYYSEILKTRAKTTHMSERIQLS